MQVSRRDGSPLILGKTDLFPLTMAAGILLYLMLSAEPDGWLLLALSAISGAGSLLLQRERRVAFTCYLIFGMSVGMMAATWETQRMAGPVLPDRSGPQTITGEVLTIYPDDKRYKILVAVEKIAGLSAEQTPRHVRVSVRGETPPPLPGSKIRLRAILFAPSSPAMPGSFDFARYFFYRDIGAVGFVLPPITIEQLPDGGHWAARLRSHLQYRVLQQMQQPEDGVAVALLTGDRTAIDEDIIEAFRDSSLAHILAISGMHMGIVCGLFFLLLRIILSQIPAIVLHYPVKKLAAILALLLGLGYLMLANFPLSATRAYVMIAMFFAGVLIDREAFTVRSLVWAAIIILLVMPSSLIEPGFQMSFAATLALIVAYRHMAQIEWGNREERKRWFLRPFIYLSGIMLTSLIASLATAPFIIHHFAQYAPYGILANLLALPLLSMVVMPFLVLAVFLMPFGAEGWALYLAGKGISGMIWVGEWVASLPGATWHVMPLTPVLLLLVVTGMFLVLFAPRWWRLAGLVCWLGGMTISSIQPLPVMLVSENGKHLALHLEADNWLLVRGKSTRHFTVEQWSERLGATMITRKKWLKNKRNDNNKLKCNESACRTEELYMPLSPYEAITLGEQVITYEQLKLNGAHAIWQEKGEGKAAIWRIEPACRPPHRRRLWSGCR